MPRKKSNCGCFSFMNIFSSKKKTQAAPLQNQVPQLLNHENFPSLPNEMSNDRSKIIRKIEIISKMTKDEVKVRKH